MFAAAPSSCHPPFHSSPPPPHQSLNLTSEGREPALVVAPRTYEDSPQPQAPQGQRKASRSLPETGEVEATSLIGDFIFSDQTAARYKEFNVVKVNKRGVRQDR